MNGVVVGSVAGGIAITTAVTAVLYPRLVRKGASEDTIGTGESGESVVVRPREFGLLAVVIADGGQSISPSTNGFDGEPMRAVTQAIPPAVESAAPIGEAAEAPPADDRHTSGGWFSRVVARLRRVDPAVDGPEAGVPVPAQAGLAADGGTRRADLEEAAFAVRFGENAAHVAPRRRWSWPAWTLPSWPGQRAVSDGQPPDGAEHDPDEFLEAARVVPRQGDVPASAVGRVNQPPTEIPPACGPGDREIAQVEPPITAAADRSPGQPADLVAAAAAASPVVDVVGAVVEDVAPADGPHVMVEAAHADVDDDADTQAPAGTSNLDYALSLITLQLREANRWQTTENDPEEVVLSAEALTAADARLAEIAETPVFADKPIVKGGIVPGWAAEYAEVGVDVSEEGRIRLIDGYGLLTDESFVENLRRVFLTDESAMVRTAALMLLSERPSVELASAAIECASQGDAGERCAAVAALTALRQRDALLSFLADDDGEIVKAAVVGLVGVVGAEETRQLVQSVESQHREEALALVAFV